MWAVMADAGGSKSGLVAFLPSSEIPGVDREESSSEVKDSGSLSVSDNTPVSQGSADVDSVELA
jgi:hypothetical protein